MADDRQNENNNMMDNAAKTVADSIEAATDFVQNAAESAVESTQNAVNSVVNGLPTNKEEQSNRNHS